MLNARTRVRLMAGFVFLLASAMPALADVRFFIPDVQMGAGRDTQLLINNKGDRDEAVSIWVLQKNGRLLGQFQAYFGAHSSRSFTVNEMFGGKPDSASGWLAAFTQSEGIELSYTLVGPNPVTLEAQSALGREVLLNLSETRGDVVRLTNASGYKNEVVVRAKDREGRILDTKIVMVEPYGQMDLRLADLKDAAFLDLLGQGDMLAVVSERDDPAGKPSAEGQSLSLVIDSKVPVGAYQVYFRFDPSVLTLSPSDVQGGSAPGFTSRPLSVSIDNASGELRIASFQVGNAPVGPIEVARIKATPVQGGELAFGIRAEEITDLKGESALSSMPTVGLFSR